MAPSGLGVWGGRLRRRWCLLREQRRALATTDEHHEDQYHADDQQPGDDVLVSADVAGLEALQRARARGALLVGVPGYIQLKLDTPA